MKKKVFIGLLFSSFVLTSCIPQEIIEDLGVITARGLDILEDDTMETTLVIFQFDAQSDTITKTVTGQGKTLKGTLNNADLESAFKLTAGKIEIEMYGRKIAEKGILPTLDTMLRDATIANTMYLTISDTTAKEILSMEENKISMNVGQYLNRTIENNATDHNFPQVTLQDFLLIYYNIGQDNVLPIFEVQEGIPKVNKIAVFQADKLVGEISIKEATLLNLILKTVKQKLIEISLPVEPFKQYLEKKEFPNEDKEVHMTFMIKKGNSKKKVIDQDNAVFETDVYLDLQLLEQSHGILLRDPHIIQLIEKEIEKKIEADFKKILDKAQELEADIFGYGMIYRTKQPKGKLSRKEWREKFPEIEVKFNVHAKLYRHGANE